MGATSGKIKKDRQRTIIEFMLKDVYTLDYLKENIAEICSIMEQGYLSNSPSCYFRQTENDEYCKIARANRIKCEDCYFKHDSIKEIVKTTFSLEKESLEAGVDEVYRQYSISISRIIEKTIKEYAKEAYNRLCNLKDKTPAEALSSTEYIVHSFELNSILNDLNEISYINIYHSTVFRRERMDYDNRKSVFTIIFKYLFPTRGN